MTVERVSGGTSLIDVLDRVLDKGIVIDAWVRVSLVGIDLVTVDAEVKVDSIDTRLKDSNHPGSDVKPSTPVAPRPYDELASEVVALHSSLKPRDPPEDDGSTGSGSGALAGTADILPRAAASRHRRPID